jgi:oligopeptide transport system substrate-binding protein
MKVKVKLKICLSLLLTTLFFISCGSSTDSSLKKSCKQELKINIRNEPASLDSRRARTLSDYSIIQTLNEGLYRKGKEGSVIDAIAESHTVSKDGLIYTFKLKETLWSNGDPLTAHDFAYAWKSSLDKSFPSPSASLLFPIKNAQAIKEGSLPVSMLGVYAKDDYTLVVELESPIPFFDKLICLPIFNPINESVAKANPLWHADASTYVCNGPFKLSSWKHANELTALKNDRYWDKNSVKLEKITMVMVDSETEFKMFENKELNWTGSPYSEIPPEAIKTLTERGNLKKKPLLGTYLIKTNTDVYPLKDPNFRKALAVSINRKELIEHVLEGAAVVATGIVPTSMGLQEHAYFNDGSENDSLEYLNLSLKVLGLNKKNLPPLTLTYPSTTRSHKIAAALQDEWRKTLGLTIRLEPLEPKIYLDKISRGDYQLACGSWTADYQDPITFLEVFKSKAVGTNNTNWESLDYTKAIEATYKCGSTAERTLAMKNAEKILMDAMPVLPIFHYTMLNLQDEDLHDVELSDLGLLDLKWAYLQK